MAKKTEVIVVIIPVCVQMTVEYDTENDRVTVNATGCSATDRTRQAAINAVTDMLKEHIEREY